MKALASDLSVSDLEQHLRVGAHFATKDECQKRVLGLFLKRGDGALFKVRRSNAERVELGCVNKECEMCVRASYKKKAGDWVVKESSLQHTCDRSEQKGRKRGIKTELVRSFVPAVDSMATVGGKRAATVREVVAKSIGVELKTTQALEIAKAGRKDPATVAVNEFRFIETYIEKLATTDPRGTYKFGQEVGDDGPTFQYSYIATSAAKDFWQHSHRYIVAVDATFLTGPLKGFMFAAVTKDAKNELVLLAFGQLKKENLDMWDLFLRNVKADFPGIKLILCDKQKGLEACHKIYPIVRFARCAKHLLDNAKDPDNNLGRITQEWELEYWRMVKAPTADAYNEAFVKAEKINAAAAKWVDACKREFAEHIFIGEGIRRFGDSTSNMAEEMFAAWSHNDFKPLPIIQLHQKIIVWQSQRMHSSRVLSQQADPGKGENSTPWMTELLTAKFWEARLSRCRTVFCDDNEYIGMVEVKGSNPTRVIEVRLNQVQNNAPNDSLKWTASTSCSCGRCKSLGRPCKHILAALRAAASLAGPKWNFLDARWLHSAYHLSTLQHQYERLHFPTTAVEFKETDGKELLPPPMEKKRGRKAQKKPYERKPDQKRVIVCKACGKEGHMMKTCPEPNAAQIARSFAKKIPPTQANYADDVDIDIAGDEDQSTATKEVEMGAKDGSVMDIAAQIARQLEAKGPGQKVRRVIVLDLE
jgi:hypothetical protein